MNLAEYLFVFVRDDLSFVLSLIAGVLLVPQNGPRRAHPPLRLAVSVLLMAAWSVLSNWLRDTTADAISRSASSIGKYLVFFILAMLCVRFCLECRISTAIFAVTIAYCLEHISQRITKVIIIFSPDMSIPVQRLILLVVAAAVFAGLYFSVIRTVAREREEFKQGNRLFLILSVMVVTADIVVSTIVMGNVIHIQDALLLTGADAAAPLLLREENSILICAHIFSILCSLMALLISMCQTRADKAMRESEFMKQLLHNERVRYEKEKVITDTINIKCHDLKYRLEALKTRDSHQELEDIRNAVDIYDAAVRTDNPALDVVLSNKSLLCLSKHITLTCIADGKRLSFMAEPDIYALFSNILDNAIEAAEQLEDEEQKIICLTVSSRKSFLFIHAENYYSGSLTFADGLPQTTKENKDYHGFGMRSIRALVEKYGGDLQLSAQDQIYILDIMLPVPEQRNLQSGA